MRYQISQSKVCKAIVTGPGSLFGESEALAMMRAGQYAKAVAHIEEHNAKIPRESQRIGQATINIWRSYQ
jgi:hypothetical protein